MPRLRAGLPGAHRTGGNRNISKEAVATLTTPISITGTGNHYGGSCQVGFSIDEGESFQVVTSYEGNCPLRNGGTDPRNQAFDFDVPADLPLGDVVFAWYV